MTLFGAESEKADMNMGSPAQVVKKLNELGYPVKNADVEILREIDHPWAAKLLEYRTVERQLNFLDQWLNKHGGKKNGRIYPYYAQNRAATGRMSSNNPNAQQIPKRQKGPSFRKLFKAAPGYKIVKADFAQVELRVVAAVSRDKTMIESIKNGIDLHTLTAANMAGIVPSEVTKVQRFNAKAVNFGLAYGMSAKTLKKYAKLNYSVDMSEDEALVAHKAYHTLYAGLTMWHSETSREVKKEVNDYFLHTHEKGIYIQRVFNTETLTGRKRYWPDWGGESLAKLTDATNTPIQGSSADITKLVLSELYRTLPEEVRIIGVIHDEVLLEAPDALAEDAGRLMLEIMRRIGSRIASPVPIDAELEISSSWGGD
jgi:DNA polymerase-1